MKLNREHFDDLSLSDISEAWGLSDEDKGEVFTKPEIVELMLKTLGLEGRLLDESVSILEPSCGHGEFVCAIAELLINEIESSEARPEPESLLNKILAFDLVPANVEKTRRQVEKILARYFSQNISRKLSTNWIRQDDFLLASIARTFSHVVGNPPYIRVENIPKLLLAEYRKRFSTMTDRADIYIAFYERSLGLLDDTGTLSFICTDRWTKNIYGRSLRGFISKGFYLQLYVDLYGQDSFSKKVLTYPAITQISRKKSHSTLIVSSGEVNRKLSTKILQGLHNKNVKNSLMSYRDNVVSRDSPWMVGCKKEIDLIQKIENKYGTLEAVGCEVYIGAATGCNKVFIVDESLDIEPDRKLPVIRSSEIRNGKICSEGKYIINTYDEHGTISLDHYPKLRRYLNSHIEKLASRHVAMKSVENWHRTIDRVYPNRAIKKKLMIPDISLGLTVVYDDGKFHPNNSIYYICSNHWDLHALKAVLISGIGELFIRAYSTKVANGFYRFQAQHLRKIRVPRWEDVDSHTKKDLIDAGKKSDIDQARKSVSILYDLSVREMEILRG